MESELSTLDLAACINQSKRSTMALEDWVTKKRKLHLVSEMMDGPSLSIIRLPSEL
jgi:hypothetical protein